MLVSAGGHGSAHKTTTWTDWEHEDVEADKEEAVKVISSDTEKTQRIHMRPQCGQMENISRM